jgi:hypothetical protein
MTFAMSKENYFLAGHNFHVKLTRMAFRPTPQELIGYFFICQSLSGANHSLKGSVRHRLRLDPQARGTGVLHTSNKSHGLRNMPLLPTASIAASNAIAT